MVNASMYKIISTSLIVILGLVVLSYPVEIPEDSTCSPQRFSFGIKLGANFANMFGTNIETLERGAYDNSSAKLGFNPGIHFSLRLTNNVYLQTGIHYSQKGFKIELDHCEIEVGDPVLPKKNEYSLYEKVYFDFVDIPLCIKLKTNENNSYKTHILLGGVFSFVTRAKIKYYEKYIEYVNSEKKRGENVLEVIDLMENVIYLDSFGNVLHYSYDAFYRNIDMGLIAGVGFEYIITDNTSLIVDCTYQLGLLNVFDLSRPAKKELSTFNDGIISDNQNIFNKEFTARFSTISLLMGLEFYF